MTIGYLTGTTGTTTITAPAGVVDGAILLCSVGAELATSGYTWPTDWVELVDVVSTSLKAGLAYYVWNTGDPTSWSVPSGAEENVCVGYTNVDPVTPFITESYTPSTAGAAVTPSVTNSSDTDNRWVACFMSEDFSATGRTISSVSSGTLRSSRAGANVGLAFADSNADITANASYQVTGTWQAVPDDAVAWIGILNHAQLAVTKNAAGETIGVTEGAATKSAIVTKTPASGETVSVTEGNAEAYKRIEKVAAGDTFSITEGAASKSRIAQMPAVGEPLSVTEGAAVVTKTTPPPEPYSPDLPIAPAPIGIGRAGGEYRLHFHDINGATVAELDMQDLTSLKWGRALSEVSRCQLDGNTASSVEVATRVRPWIHWVSVYRAEEYVWTGLVTDLAVRSRSWTAQVKDLSTLMWRTRVPVTRTWRDTDPLEIGADLWDAMVAFQRLPVPPARRLSSNVSYSLDIVQDRNMVHQAMDDVVKLGAEWTVIGGLAVFEPALRTPDLELSHTRLSDCDFEAELEVVFDGSRFFNDTRFQGKNFASTAVIEVAGLHMQNLISMDNLFGEGNITLAAQQAVAKTGKPRTAIIVPPGATLNLSAPIEIAELVPGVVIPVWTDIGGGVQDYLRLESMEVTVDAGMEKVAVTLGEIPDVTDLGETVQ